MPNDSHDSIELMVDGRAVVVGNSGASLLEVLRDQLGIVSVKDGCSPQGQCGCCTVLVDGQPRVSCVTPARRVRGREITTVDGLDASVAEKWAEAFHSTGGSQCGFCTPGIICRFEGLRSSGVDPSDRGAAAKALQAHLCRCTGWQTVLDAWSAFGTSPGTDRTSSSQDSARRAEIEGGSPQTVDPAVALGRGGFADDAAPSDALIAFRVTGESEWAVAENQSDARLAAGKVQGRRTTGDWGHPLEVPPGDWDLVLATTWVEPAYLETDASWCLPGGAPALARCQRRGVRFEVRQRSRRRCAAFGRRVRPTGSGHVCA